jgi:hypothetical protein
MTIAMTKDLNPPTPFLFPASASRLDLALAARSPDRRVPKTGQLGAPHLDVPFFRGRARRFFKF